MSPKLTFYGSAGEIGGNKILLEDGNHSLLFDFGIAFGRSGMFYNEFLRPRAARGLLDLLATGLIPPLEGLYRDDLTPVGMWEQFRDHPAYRRLNSLPEGVFISHAHLDHNGDLSYLDPSIPIYTTRISAFIARSMQVTGISSFEREMVFINPRVPNVNGELGTERNGMQVLRAHRFLDGNLSHEAAAAWGESSGKKPMKVMPHGSAGERIGGLPLRWWQVDHSIPGAAGCAVETSCGWVGYSGDIRFHGRNGRNTWEFAQGLAALRPDTLLCEGTHLHDRRQVSEDEVQENALRLVQKAAGRLVIADFGPRNVERLISFLEIATQTGRRLTILPKDLYMLQAMAQADAQYQELLESPSLALYNDPKIAPRGWEQGLRASLRHEIVNPDDILRNRGSFILAWSLWDLNDLVDLRGCTGGLYIYSNSKAYDDEQEADLDRLRNWVRLMEMELVGDPDDPHSAALHASGHASGTELVEFVRTVNPRRLVPIHTEDPAWWLEQLRGSNIEVVIPTANGVVRL